MTEEREPEEQVEDLDVPAEESEDVKGGAFDAFNKLNTSVKLNPAGLKEFGGNLNINK
jgi:hypothetical protein